MIEDLPDISFQDWLIEFCEKKKFKLHYRNSYRNFLIFNLETDYLEIDLSGLEKDFIKLILHNNNMLRVEIKAYIKQNDYLFLTRFFNRTINIFVKINKLKWNRKVLVEVRKFCKVIGI